MGLSSTNCKHPQMFEVNLPPGCFHPLLSLHPHHWCRKKSPLQNPKAPSSSVRFTHNSSPLEGATWDVELSNSKVSSFGSTVPPHPGFPVTNEGFFVGIPEPKNVSCHPGADEPASWVVVTGSSKVLPLKPPKIRGLFWALEPPMVVNEISWGESVPLINGLK